MKKLVLLVYAMTFAFACAPPTNQSVATNTATQPPAPAPLTEAEAITKEKAIWDALKRKDFDAFGNMLATDYLEVLPDGVNDKTTTLMEVKDLAITDVTFADWRLIPLDKDAAVLIYNATIKGTFKGQAFPEGPYRVASGWVNRDAKWQPFYYQETLTATASPAPSPTASAPAASPSAPAASPAASATVASVPADPVEREKFLWDMLRRKDYEGFASHLDSGQVEVEANGVFDKARTMQSVRLFDLAKVELSDFRTAKVNPNVELVTYLVTQPGPTPEKQLSTTIWVNRAGKWLAMFHQGTDMRTMAAPSPSASAPVADPAK